MRLSRRLAILALLPLVALLAACGDSDGGASADRDAEKGGGQKLTLYSGRVEDLLQPLVDRFTEETGIEVEVRYGASAEMAAQLAEEGDATPADVFYSQEVGAIGVLEAADLLGELPDDVVQRVDERFRPESGNRWVGVTGRSRVIVYNPDLIDAPAGVEELTDPEYKGKVAIVPENAGFQAFVTGFRVSKGEDAARQWLEDLLANEPVTSIESNDDVLQAVEAGDVPIGLINHYYWARDERQPDMTSKLVFPSGDDPGGLVNASAAAVTAKGADNPAAQAFVEYLVSDAGQRYFLEDTFEYPLVAGIGTPKGVPPLDELEGPQLSLTDLESLEQTQALLTELGLLG